MNHAATVGRSGSIVSGFNCTDKSRIVGRTKSELAVMAAADPGIPPGRGVTAANQLSSASAAVDPGIPLGRGVSSSAAVAGDPGTPLGRGIPPGSGVAAVVANSSSAAARGDPDPGTPLGRGVTAANSSSSAAAAGDPESWPDIFADEDSSGYFVYYDQRLEEVVRVEVPSSSSLMSTTSTPTNTDATAAGWKPTGLEEVFADDGAKVGDNTTAASLLSLDTLAEIAVRSINKGVIQTGLSKYMYLY